MLVDSWVLITTCPRKDVQITDTLPGWTLFQESKEHYTTYTMFGACQGYMWPPYYDPNDFCTGVVKSQLTPFVGHFL
jgi:hypothetical protein